MAAQSSLTTPDRDSSDLYERYRVHQKDLFKQCVDDARLLAKRTRLQDAAPDADAVVSLALTLFAKRCEAWTEFRAGAGM